MQPITKKTKLTIICGATAVGKSSVAIELAKKFNAEIISSDSIQVYKKFNVGTAKLSKSEMQGIQHYLIDILEPTENYSVNQFVIDSKNAISNIFAKGKNVIVCGGTGFYISSLIQGYNLANTEPNIELREKYEKLAAKHGTEHLHSLLKKVDLKSAERIAANDTKRIIRALEIFELTGKSKSDSVEQVTNSEFDTLQIVVEDDREVLYNRINNRVDDMIKNGLQEEVRSLVKYKDCLSMQAIGYKEFLDYFDRNETLQAAIDKIKQRSRNYAKRQITFFKHNVCNNKHFVNNKDLDKIFKLTHSFLS